MFFLFLVLLLVIMFVLVFRLGFRIYGRAHKVVGTLKLPRELLQFLAKFTAGSFELGKERIVGCSKI